MRRTNLQRAAELNHAQFRMYLALVHCRGLVSIVRDAEGTQWVHLTPTGYYAERSIAAAISHLEGSGLTTPEGGQGSEGQDGFAQR
jgi:hypothetical protein